jgi:hypothetical protein
MLLVSLPVLFNDLFRDFDLDAEAAKENFSFSSNTSVVAESSSSESCTTVNGVKNCTKKETWSAQCKFSIETKGYTATSGVHYSKIECDCQSGSECTYKLFSTGLLPKSSGNFNPTGVQNTIPCCSSCTGSACVNYKQLCACESPPATTRPPTTAPPVTTKPPPVTTKPPTTAPPVTTKPLPVTTKPPTTAPPTTSAPKCAAFKQNPFLLTQEPFKSTANPQIVACTADSKKLVTYNVMPNGWVKNSDGTISVASTKYTGTCRASSCSCCTDNSQQVPAGCTDESSKTEDVRCPNLGFDFEPNCFKKTESTSLKQMFFCTKSGVHAPSGDTLHSYDVQPESDGTIRDTSKVLQESKSSCECFCSTAAGCGCKVGTLKSTNPSCPTTATAPSPAAAAPTVTPPAVCNPNGMVTSRTDCQSVPQSMQTNALKGVSCWTTMVLALHFLFFKMLV